MHSRSTDILSILFFLLLMSLHTSATEKETIDDSPKIPSENKTIIGFDPMVLMSIDLIAQQGIAQQAFPACQILIMHQDKLVYNQAFGAIANNNFLPINTHTLFDLASVTKTSATLFAVMKLYDDGKLGLQDKASKYLAYLKHTNKANITIEDLLFHSSGLQAYIGFYPLKFEALKEGEAAIDRLAAMRIIARTPLKSKTYRYSCLNFILLQQLVEVITQEPMDAFLNRNFYKPMGLNYITYKAFLDRDIQLIAPTTRYDFVRQMPLQGKVHDPLSASLGGVSGNAGLFSNAEDLAQLYKMLMNKGMYKGQRYLSEMTCQLFMQTTSKSGFRGLGFDRATPFREEWNPCAPSAPVGVFGHTGFTGTCFWVDPINELIYVFLSNRTYYEGKNKAWSSLSIRSTIQELMYQAIIYADNPSRNQ